MMMFGLVIVVESDGSSVCRKGVYSVISVRLVFDCCFDGFFFQAEDGIRDLVRSRGLGDVYKRQGN